MISTVILSSFLICAVPPPPALVDGPEHRPAFVELFDMLVDYSWRRADIRIGERERRTAILIGRDPAIEDTLLRDGWHLLMPPYFPSSTSLVIHLPYLGGNLDGVDRIVTDLRIYLIPGGFFIVPPFDFEDFLPSGVEDVERLIMRGFHKTQFTATLNRRHYSIWQKRSYWMRRAA